MRIALRLLIRCAMLVAASVSLPAAAQCWVGAWAGAQMLAEGDDALPPA